MNGTKQKQVSFSDSGGWSTFADKVENVTLLQGSNIIMYKYDAGDNGNINIDFIKVGSIITGQNEQNNQLANMSVYPNPASNNLHIDFGKTVDKADISVCDLQGRVLIQKSVQNANMDNLDISNLSKGMFTLKVRNANQTSNFKFVKQ